MNVCVLRRWGVREGQIHEPLRQPKRCERIDPRNYISRTSKISRLEMNWRSFRDNVCVHKEDSRQTHRLLWAGRASAARELRNMYILRCNYRNGLLYRSYWELYSMKYSN